MCVFQIPNTGSIFYMGTCFRCKEQNMQFFGKYKRNFMPGAPH